MQIIAYHYVRELKNTRYPEIKGIAIDKFREQVLFLKSKFAFVKIEELIEAVYSKKNKLPENPCLLTFDDGYIDHYTNVFPILDEHKIQGCFFPSAGAVLKNKLIDVNKIQFIIASTPKKNEIVDGILSMLDKYRTFYSLNENDYYLSKFAKSWRLDSKEVIFIKRMLQKELPINLRSKIIESLFCEYVSKDETLFAKELYLSLDQLKCMRRNGMYIGGHGFNHYWLGDVDVNTQGKEISLTLQLLKRVGMDINKWVMCYPCGSYNNTLISLLKQKGCKIGLAMKIADADINRDDPFSLPRLRPNDLPV